MKDWKALSNEERRRISKRYDTRPVPPLYMPDLLWTPQAVAMLSKFKELADASTPPIPEVQPGQKPPPMRPVPAMALKGGSVYWCLFEVSFSDSQDRLKDRFLAWLKQPAIERLWRKHKGQGRGKASAPVRVVKSRHHWDDVYHCLFEVNLSARKGDLRQQFRKWLPTPENRKRLKRYGKQKRGTTGDSLDRLRDLAAWRLYREMGNDCEKANRFADENRRTFKSWAEVYTTSKKVNGRWPYSPGEPRPFHGAKPVKSKDAPFTPANEADLYSCDEDYRHAKQRAMQHLSDSFPREFRKPGSAMARMFTALRKIAKMTS